MISFSSFEHELIAAGIRCFAGVDEAGRGPLAGPVVAAAVIFPPGITLEGVDDSKRLTAARRQAVAALIRERAEAWAVAESSPEEIDRINILQASILAMHRAVAALTPQPAFLLIDGNRFHHPGIPFRTIVKGDARCFSIAAASILAKVHRDGIMDAFAADWPAYGFERHRGYPTPEHINAIKTHGYLPFHRKSFTVRELSQPSFDFIRDENEHRHRTPRRNARG